jgi:hypothetical protein
MRIGVELNGVLRDTLKKIQQEYEKWYLNNPFKEEAGEEDFEYEVISDLTSLDISKHLKFKNEDELYDFLYKEHTMEIFGHAGSVEPSGLLELNEFYLDMREQGSLLKRHRWNKLLITSINCRLKGLEQHDSKIIYIF